MVSPDLSISLNRDNNRMYYEGVIATEESLPIFVNCIDHSFSLDRMYKMDQDIKKSCLFNQLEGVKILERI